MGIAPAEALLMAARFLSDLKRRTA
jgi:hypothetical protein